MQSSCEPCRQDKVRCDHKLPVCSRCQRRRIHNGCFYHPAPLTRQKTSLPASSSPISNGELSGTTGTKTDRTRAESINCKQDSSEIISQPLGYLGETSFAAYFVADNESSIACDADTEIIESESTNILPHWWFQKVTEALSILVDFPLLERLVTDFYGQSPAIMIPEPFVKKAFPSIRKLCAEYLPRRIAQFTSEIVDNTAKPFVVAASISGSQFHQLYTGANLRLEIIGIILCQAGRSTEYGTGSGAFFIKGTPRTRAQFARSMYRASDTILQVCHMLTQTHDLLLWLVYEKMALSDAIYGASTEALWNQLGDLSSRIISLGAHRQSGNSTNTPDFLSQTRKRLFATSYRVDKSLATFLGRPPRLSYRYSNCGLPLCIEDEAFDASSEEFRNSMKNTDRNGWCLQESFHSASWIRLRSLNAIMREEVLDMYLQPSKVSTLQQVRDLERRCNDQWQTYPEYLRFTPAVLCKNYETMIVNFLIISYIDHLYNQFLIQRLLVRQHHASNTDLVYISAEILSTVLLLSPNHAKSHDIYINLTSSIQLNGFPAASVLIEVLKIEARTGIFQADQRVSRAQMISDLCVFVSKLNPVVRPSGLDNGHALLKHAQLSFQKIVNDAIDRGCNGDQTDARQTKDNTLAELQSCENISSNLMGTDFPLDSLDFGVLDQWLL